MIWESHPWRRVLSQQAKNLQKRKKQRRWSEASFFKIEQGVFLSAYVVRKLLEAQKVSDEIESILVPCLVYKPHGRVVDIMNWHKLDKLYDMTQSIAKNLSLRGLCNQVIHSFIFMPTTESDGGLDGFFVASDRQKFHGLFFFEIDPFIDVLTQVAKDDIVWAAAHRDSVSGEMKIIKKSNGLNAYPASFLRNFQANQ